MFDIGYQELIVIAIVAIIVIGPKDLPHFLRTIGKYIRQIKRQVSDIQREVTRAIDTEEMRDFRKDIHSITDINSSPKKNSHSSDKNSSPSSSHDQNVNLTQNDSPSLRRFIPKTEAPSDKTDLPKSDLPKSEEEGNSTA